MIHQQTKSGVNNAVFLHDSSVSDDTPTDLLMLMIEFSRLERYFQQCVAADSETKGPSAKSTELPKFLVMLYLLPDFLPFFFFFLRDGRMVGRGPCLFFCLCPSFSLIFLPIFSEHEVMCIVAAIQSSSHMK